MAHGIDNGIVDEKIALNMLRGMMKETLKENTDEFVRRKKMYVTAGAHDDGNGRSVITVQEAFGEEFDIPYAPSLYAVSPGDSVWVEWVFGFGNACAVNSGAWQASDLPTCVVPTEDGLIMQVNYRPVMTVGANGISIDAETLDVNGHIAGDVVNTQEAASVTVNGKIQDALDSLGKYLKGDVTVNVPDDTYVEDVNVEGFHGPGALRIVLSAGVTVVGDWRVTVNGRIILSGNSGTVGGVSVTSTLIGSLEDAVVDVSGTDYFEMTGTSVHGAERQSGDAGQDYGVRIAEGTYGFLKQDEIDRTQIAVYVEHAHLDMVNCSGGAFSTDETTAANLTNGVEISPDGGSVNVKSHFPAGPDSAADGYDAHGYPFTLAGGATQAVSTGGAPAPVTEVTATWTSSAGYYCSSYQSGSTSYLGRATGWKGDGTYNLRMGYNTADSKFMAGLWVFSDADTIASTLNGATIKKATLSLKRSGANGAASGTVVKPYYHGITAAGVASYAGQCDPWAAVGSSTDKYTDCGCAEQYIAFGATGTFELPSAMYPLLKDGTVKGFAIGMNHQTPFFQFVPLGCVLTVTYEV